MSIYKPSILRSFLNQMEAVPQKRLSQNFLIDKNIIQKIVLEADIQKGDCVLEIGPGPGVLTEALLEKGAHVIAIEKDPKFAQALQRFQTSDHRLTVLEADALTVELNSILSKGLKVVANLPYNVATAILIRFLPKHHYLKSLTVMVQKEVGERLIAKPSTKSYSSLTLFVRFYSEASLGFHIKPTCFYPAPKVHSSVIHFKIKKPIQLDSEAFFQFVRNTFQKRRKMLRASLRSFYDPEVLRQGLEKIGKGHQVRPEELSLEDFITLFREIQNSSSNTDKK